MVIRILFIAYLIIPILTSAQINMVDENCLTQNAHDDRYASYSPSGDKIVFESNRDGNWEIYMMDAAGTNQERLTFHDSLDRRPNWHPGGEAILFESSRSGNSELYIKELETGEVTSIFSSPNGVPIFGSFSPDGQTIALSLRASDSVSNIILVNTDGEIVKALTNHARRSYFPKWSSDGREIVYFSRKETNNQDDEIYKLNLESDIETRLTNWPKHNFCPSWSPDNSRIVYVTSMEGIRPEIYIMNADGSNQVRITNNEDGDTLPDWSPDGDKLLITGYRNGNFEICELRLQFGEE